jgi:hypothetical protein
MDKYIFTPLFCKSFVSSNKLIVSVLSEEFYYRHDLILARHIHMLDYVCPFTQ